MSSEPSLAQLRILLVCVSRLICDALETMLEVDHECVIVGKAKTVTEAIRLRQIFCPSIIIVDPDLPDGVDIQFVEQLSEHNSEAPIVVLTLCTRPSILSRLLQLNIQACLTKDLDRNELITTLKLLKNSGRQKALSTLLFNQLTSRSSASALLHERLTKREKQVLSLVLQGKTNKNIAEIIHVSPQSIRNYLYTIYRKLSVKTRMDLVLLFYHNQMDNF